MARIRQAEPRRKPSQERSRRRIRLILEAARELILESGTDALVVNDIAGRAGVPIGSVYQYFAGKTGIIRALAEEHLAELKRILLRDLEPFTPAKGDAGHIREASDRIIESYYEFYRGDPTFRLIWGGTQGDPMLRELDVRDTQESARILSAILRRFYPRMNPNRLKGLCLLIADITASSLRLTLELDETQGRAIVEELKDMVGGHLESRLP